MFISDQTGLWDLHGIVYLCKKVSLPEEVKPGHKEITDFLKNKALLKELLHLQHLLKTSRAFIKLAIKI